MSRRTSAPIALLVSTVLALALTGCSGDGDADASASPAPAATAAAPAFRGSYATPDAVIAALNSGSTSCAEPMAGTYEGVSAAKSCIFGGSEDVIALVFASPAEKEGYLAGREALSSVVLGKDWAVQTVLAKTADTIAATLGGEVRGPAG